MATRPTGPRYRRISVQMWGDDKFRALSKPQPNGQSLWQFLLTGPHTLNVPGLFVAGEAMLAESLNWPLTKFRCAWSELELADLVQCDWAARVVWIPKAVNHNLPESPNVVRSWWETIPLIPVSPIRDTAVAQLREACERKGEAYLKAFDEGFLKAFPKAFRELMGKPSGEPSGKGEAKPKVNQDQDQEQEQEKDLTQTLSVPERAKPGQGCAYCGATAEQTGWGLEYDHVVPKSAGGSDGPENRVWSCHPCNQAKSGRVFLSVDDAREWLHHAFWNTNRQRWIAHRAIAFGGKPPDTQAIVPTPWTWESCRHTPHCGSAGRCAVTTILEEARAKKAVSA